MPRFVFALLLLFLIQPLRADFSAGCAAYDAGKYKTALKEFNAIAETQLSPQLAYNIGCAYTKLDDAGKATLWFQRALLLDPTHRESQQNIRFLLRKEAPVGYETTTLEMLSALAKPARWQTAWFVCMWAMILTLALLVFVKPRRIWPWVLIMCVGALLGIATGIGWFTRLRETPPSQLSIVTDTEVSANNAPAESADSVIPLPPGSKVRPLQTRGEYSYIEVPNQEFTRGWVKTSRLTPLWPYAPELVK